MKTPFDDELRIAAANLAAAEERVRQLRKAKDSYEATVLLEELGLRRHQVIPLPAEPFFMVVMKFAEWADEQNDPRPYLEWNGEVWTRSPLARIPVRYNEVPE